MPNSAIQWLADENFDNDILRGLRRRSTGFDAIRVQDIGEIAGADDATVLAWAAANDRILLTHDVSTMIRAMQSIAPGWPARIKVLLVPDSLPIGIAIEDILLLNECSEASDWGPGVVYLPLR
jgi:predicted nuclease of predicted toxin-antitoxin system